MDPNITLQVNSRLRTEDRFSNYREMASRFDSPGICGHAIKKGDLIGWNRRYGARCSDCWSTWKAENAAAAADEAMMSGGSW